MGEAIISLNYRFRNLEIDGVATLRQKDCEETELKIREEKSAKFESNPIQDEWETAGEAR